MQGMVQMAQRAVFFKAMPLKALAQSSGTAFEAATADAFRSQVEAMADKIKDDADEFDPDCERTQAHLERAALALAADRVIKQAFWVSDEQRAVVIGRGYGVQLEDDGITPAAAVPLSSVWGIFGEAISKLLGSVQGSDDAAMKTKTAMVTAFKSDMGCALRPQFFPAAAARRRRRRLPNAFPAWK